MLLVVHLADALKPLKLGSVIAVVIACWLLYCVPRTVLLESVLLHAVPCLVSQIFNTYCYCWCCLLAWCIGVSGDSELQRGCSNFHPRCFGAAQACGTG